MTNSTFAIYGVSLEVPEDWTVEVNPKSNRQKCDIAFHMEEGNKFYLSWGVLNEAQERFKTLDEHVDFSLKQVQKGRDVDSLETVERKDGEVNGHRSIFARVSVLVRSGFMGRTATRRVFLSTHFYCPETMRFYVVYLLSGSAQVDEESMITTYRDVMSSFRCHPTSNPS
ncbi:MAG: hypothetical protein JRN68_01580 [Nitrososphaerota archaeon]|nr:hypothetical protein [Nitrososphaerota archaeon]